MNSKPESALNRREFAARLTALSLPLGGVLSANPAALAVPADAAQALAPPALDNQYRGYIVDHHSPDPPALTYAKFDPEQWLRMYDTSQLDHVWVFCKGHHGEAYYPTRTGHMQPGLKTDFVKAAADGLRRRGMAFHAYYCIGFDDWAPMHHPDWANITEDGKPRRVEHPIAQWHWTCLNTPYRKYVLGQLAEIVEGYKPDGFFLDIMGQPLCYCPGCAKLYQARYGHAIPRGDEAVRLWRETDEFLYQTTQLSMIREIVQLVRSMGSKAAITLNGGHIDFRKEVLDLLDYTFAEPFAGNYLSAMFARGTGKLPQIGPGNVAKVYDPSPVSIFQAQAAMIAAQNCRPFMYSETMNQDGVLDPLWFRTMGRAFHDIAEIQPHLRQRDPVPCVAIVYSEKTRFHDRADLRGLKTRDQSSYFDHRSALRGAMEAGVQSQFPCDILPDCKLTDDLLRPYQALVLPEVTCLSPAETNVIEKWVHSGGLLVATGLTSTLDADGVKLSNFSLANLLGCDYVTVEDRYLANRWGSYLQRGADPLWKNLPDTSLVVEAPFIEVQPHPGTEVLATHILPAVLWHEDKDHDDQAWVNWEPPPPGQPSNHPAVLRNRLGKGQVIYATFDLFGMTDRKFLWPGDLLREVLLSALPQPPLRVELKHGQAALGTTFYKKQKEASLVVHQVNRAVDQLNGRAPDAEGGTLQIDESCFRVRRCRQVFPQLRDLPLQRTAHGTSIIMPPVQVHTVVVIEG